MRSVYRFELSVYQCVIGIFRCDRSSEPFTINVGDCKPFIAVCILMIVMSLLKFFCGELYFG